MISLKISVRGIILLVTLATFTAWLLLMQPWREERFRPYAEMKHELNSKQLRIELSARKGTDVGLYSRKDGARWSCLAIGSQLWNYEAGPERFTYSYGSLQRRGAYLYLEKRWACDDLPERLVVVPWGPRYYLLFENELESFQQAVDNGTEPRKTIEGNFFMLDGDESKPTTGLPSLPSTIE